MVLAKTALTYLVTRERSVWLANSFSLVDYDPRDGERPYAILSHRWGKDEVTYQDIRQGTVKKKEGGFTKLQFCAEQAARDGLLYFWVDTCCIDKTNNTELSEAINSMYKWYERAMKCYVYLPDVSSEQEWKELLHRSEWFQRGWTLQELIAPRVVEFFSKEGIKLGSKRSLGRQINQVSGIAIEVLRGTKPLSEFSEQQRLSWTARRHTTVEEDAVYCLLGIFNVHMPLIYGEGQQKALVRLQQEIRLLDNPDMYAIKQAVWIVPFERNAQFTGRDSQLAELERILAPGASTSKVAVIGLGGVGKTQLVLELLYRTKEKHIGCSIMWIAATSMASVEQGYLTVAQQLNIPGCDEQKADVKKLVQDYLSRDEVEPWVLVYDNADDFDLWTTIASPTSADPGKREGRHPLPVHRPRRLIDYLPRHPRGCIIFTTRNRRVAVTLAPSSIVAVPAMSQEAATELLTTSLNDTGLVNSSREVSKLLATLTYLPLAITQATAYINTSSITLAEYLALLNEKEEEVIEVLSEDFEDYGRDQDIKNPIAKTWLVSFEQIRRSDPLATEYLSFMACVNPRDVPQSLLPPGPSRKKEIDAIGTLSAYSFVSRQPNSTSLDLHRLVHLTTRNWLRTNGTLQSWTDKTISRLEEVLPEQDYKHEHRAIWRSYLPHAQQVLASSIINKDGEESMNLAWKYGQCLSSDGRWHEAELIFSQILAAQKEMKGKDSMADLIATTWLASTYRNQGRYEESEQLGVQVMETSKTKLGADHPDTLTSIANLASTWKELGRDTEAMQLMEDCVRRQSHILGPTHPDALSSHKALAKWEAERQDIVSEAAGREDTV